MQFSFDTLKVGGHFVAKFYQGAEDRAFEARLKKLFAVVHREKPESSRSVSVAPSCFLSSARDGGLNVWWLVCVDLLFESREDPLGCHADLCSRIGVEGGIFCGPEEEK